MMSEMEKKHIIKGLPLIKFQDEEKIDYLRSGIIYANTFNYYRNKEQETGDPDLGDEYEAMIHIQNGYIYFPDSEKVKILEDNLIQTSYSNDYVFCMFGISFTGENYTFTDKQKDKMLTFGDKALIVLDFEEFKKRVIKGANDNDCVVYFGKVQYYDTHVDGGNFLFSLTKGMWNVAFWKRKRYSYQQEYRFLFVPNHREKQNIKDHIEINIGDISDITKVVSSRELLDSYVKKCEGGETNGIA